MKQKAYIVLFAILILTYLGLNLLIAPTKEVLQHYDLTLLHARVLTASFVIPIAIIYTIGAYGAIKMKQYSLLIKSSKEGKYFNRFSNGLLILVLAQAITSVSNSLVSIVALHKLAWLPTVTVLNNYMVLLLTGFSLAVIALAAKNLISLLPKKSSGWEQHIIMLIFVALSAAYSYLIVAQPIHTTLARRTYFMPNWLVLITIAIPYLYVWYMGFWGAYQLFNFQKRVKGLIYKNSLVYVAGGLALVISSSIVIRILATISAQINRLKLTPILFIIYGFLLLIGVGFILITLGTRKLRRIEEA